MQYAENVEDNTQVPLISSLASYQDLDTEKHQLVAALKMPKYSSLCPAVERGDIFTEVLKENKETYDVESGPDIKLKALTSLDTTSDSGVNLNIDVELSPETEPNTNPSSKEKETTETLTMKTLTKEKLIKVSKQTSTDATSTPTRSNTCENCGQELNSTVKVNKVEELEKSPSEQSMTSFCRICHCDSNSESGPLIAPCRCKGSLEYVHQSCLQQWIKSSDYKHCELCGFHFAMNSKLKPITKWEKLSMSTSERRKLVCSVMFHIIAITCVVWSLYVLIEKTAIEFNTGNLFWPFWTKLIVVAIGFIGGMVFMYVQCKVYVQLWKRLKAFNRIIYVQDQPPMPGTHRTSRPEDGAVCTSTSAGNGANSQNGDEVVVVDVCENANQTASV